VDAEKLHMAMCLVIGDAIIQLRSECGDVTGESIIGMIDRLHAGEVGDMAVELAKDLLG